MSVQGNKYMFSGGAMITVFSYNAAYVCSGGARDLRQKTGNCPYAVTAGIRFKAIPHNDRLTALHAACLHISVILHKFSLKYVSIPASNLCKLT